MKYQLYSFLFYILAWLPLSILYIFSDILYVIIYRCGRYRLNIARQNLRKAFPEADEKTWKEIEQKFYHHFCDNIVETIKLLHISDREIDKRVKVINGELVDRFAKQRKPIILLLGHYGNWEWVPAITRHYSRAIISGQIYRPLKDKAFDRLMLRIRSRFHSISIPQKRAFRTLLRIRAEHRIFLVGFIADQRPNSSMLNHWTQFLHQETAYSPGGEEIGKHVDAAYVYLDVEKQRRGHYRMTFQEIIPLQDGQLYPYTRQYLRMLEKTILREPAYWLWTHRRWLFSKDKSRNYEEVCRLI